MITRTKRSFAMLNLYPYSSGHILVSPVRHVKSMELLRQDEILDLIGLLNRVKLLLDRVMKPHGCNIGINIGKVAGAGVAGHLHIHIVPRWIGDANFMPTASSTRVISQSLEHLHRDLVRGLKGKAA